MGEFVFSLALAELTPFCHGWRAVFDGEHADLRHASPPKSGTENTVSVAVLLLWRPCHSMHDVLVAVAVAIAVAVVAMAVAALVAAIAVAVKVAILVAVSAAVAVTASPSAMTEPIRRAPTPQLS